MTPTSIDATWRSVDERFTVGAVRLLRRLGLVDADPFAERDVAFTGFGAIYAAHSPMADALAIHIDSFTVELTKIGLVCGGSTTVFSPANSTIAILRDSPLPCTALVIELAFESNDTKYLIVTIKLDDSPLPSTGHATCCAAGHGVAGQGAPPWPEGFDALFGAEAFAT